jgi:hypothetical protein
MKRRHASAGGLSLGRACLAPHRRQVGDGDDEKLRGMCCAPSRGSAGAHDSIEGNIKRALASPDVPWPAHSATPDKMSRRAARSTAEWTIGLAGVAEGRCADDLRADPMRLRGRQKSDWWLSWSDGISR